MEKKKALQQSLSSYIIGFFFSFSLTLVAYISVITYRDSHHTAFSPGFILPWIFVLAFLQLIVQLLFFLHLGREKKPYFNAIFLMMTAGMIALVIIASIWIMNHLNYNMTPKDIQQYIHDQSGF